jgi:hypothetical protein
MKRRLAVLFFIGLAAAGNAFSQVRMNGYFSMDFLKGQNQSPYARGSTENIRAGLIFSGEWTPQFSYALEVQTKEAMKPEIEQAWAGFASSEAFQLKVGLYLVPFGKYNASGRAFQTSLVESPYPVGEFCPSSWRDLGVLVEGKIGFLQYAAYLGNGLAEAENLGAGQQFKDNNSDKGKGVRLAFTPSQNLEVGFSYYTGKYDDANERNLSLQGLDATWTATNFNMKAEYSRAFVDNPAPLSRGKAEGFFVELWINLGTLSPVLAYEKSKYEDAFHGLQFAAPLQSGLGIFSDHNRWAFGFVYSPHENILLKVEYELNREKNLELQDNIFRAQVAVHF